MESYAILALQLMNDEARSALPDAPVVDDRPSRLGRLAGTVAAAGRRLRESVPAALPKRADVRRAA
ncbi:hypothetical protein [Glycomyces tarimensis]